ncbi:deoxyribodipyrimidine photo-lyase [Planctomycetota bacterium]
MIQPERVEKLNNKPLQRGRYVLYWMQAAQRSEYNHALEYAIQHGNRDHLPVVVLFCLIDDFPEANLRHYHFMLQGLQRTQQQLTARDIQMVVYQGSPEVGVPRFAEQANQVVVDAGHLRIERQWRRAVANQLTCTLTEIETNVIVPIEQVSDKENYSAGTLRPRIQRQLETYLTPLRHTRPKHSSLDLPLTHFDISDLDGTLAQLKLDRSVPAAPGFVGGTAPAKKRLQRFLAKKIDRFADLRNDPSLDYTSGLSPFLHFGQISPLYIALQANKNPSPGKVSFLEELIVRRELAFNFVHYNPKYDNYEGLAPWARRTLNFHQRDKRDSIYSLEQFEKALTHDPYWNAAQQEMVLTGKMHGYMRMYWGKKILEWSRRPAEGFKITLALNNKYELDGRDPNAFAGVVWCFGQHDRAWGERPVFGKVRYMNANGLKRKFDIEAYVERIRCLVNAANPNGFD